MLSLRSFARAAPRSFSRLTATSRPAVSAFRNSARLQASWTPIARATASPFSTSIRRLQGSEELVAKLDSEIGVEEDSKNSSESKDFLDYFKDSEWELSEQPGSQEVKLSRKYNDEHIDISFSVADASSADPSAMESAEDQAYEDEEFDETEITGQSGGANTKGSVNKGRTSEGNIRVAPEDKVAPADRPELGVEGGEYAEEETERQAGFPVRMVIKITREGKQGALEIDAEAQGGYIEIANVSHWPSADLTARTADAESKRDTMYGGPSFGTLDEDLQRLMDEFLEERGVDLEMALRLPQLVDWKEQQEYVRWLHQTRDFLA